MMDTWVLRVSIPHSPKIEYLQKKVLESLRKSFTLLSMNYGMKCVALETETFKDKRIGFQWVFYDRADFELEKKMMNKINAKILGLVLGGLRTEEYTE